MALTSSMEDYLEAVFMLQKRNGYARCTDVAEQIYEKHRFFTDRLIEAGVDPVTAEKDACRMEHVISDESFQRLKATSEQKS